MVSNFSKSLRISETILTLSLFLSYAFWYEKHLRSYGILLISFIGIVALIQGKFSFTKLTRSDGTLLLCFICFSLYHLSRSLLGWDQWNEFDRYSRAMLAIPFGLILANVLSERLYRILLVLLAGSIISFFIAVMRDLIWLDNDSIVTLGMNAIQLSFTCSIYTILVTCLMICSNDYKEKLRWWVLFFISLSGIILSARLSGFLFLASLVVLFVIISFKFYKKTHVILFLIILTISLVCFFYFTEFDLETRILATARLLTKFYQNWDQVLTDAFLAGKDTSVGPRIMLWKHGIRLVGNSFWFGIGKESLEMSYANNYALVDFFKNVTPNLHNGFIQELVVKGYVGFLLFLSIIIIPLGYFWDSLRFAFTIEIKVVSFMGIGVIFVFVLNNLTQVIFGHMNGVLMYSFTVMLLWATLYSLRNGDTLQQKLLS